MKKQVIFSIGVIYLVSLIVVTFFGMQIRMDQFQIYISYIKIVNCEIYTDGTKHINIDYDPENYTSTFVHYEIGPDNATYPSKVAFSISNASYTNENGETTVYAGVTKNGEVWFQNLTRSRTVIVTVYTTDGSQLSDKVSILCRVAR